jgi:hypothetical protein
LATFSSTQQPSRRGGSRSTYDLEALHRLLWLRSDSRHHIEIVSGELAEELLVHDRVLRRCLERLQRGGQLRFLENVGSRGRRLFVVSPPSA